MNIGCEIRSKFHVFFDFGYGNTGVGAVFLAVKCPVNETVVGSGHGRDFATVAVVFYVLGLFTGDRTVGSGDKSNGYLLEGGYAGRVVR